MKRHPDNQDVIDDEFSASGADMDRLTRIIASAVAREVNDKLTVNYTEGGANDRLLKWLLGVVSTLLIAFIIGSVVGYGTMQALQAIVEQQQRQIDRIENRLDGRSGVTRGANDAAAR